MCKPATIPDDLCLRDYVASCLQLDVACLMLADTRRRSRLNNALAGGLRHKNAVSPA